MNSKSNEKEIDDNKSFIKIDECNYMVELSKIDECNYKVGEPEI